MVSRGVTKPADVVYWELVHLWKDGSLSSAFHFRGCSFLLIFVWVFFSECYLESTWFENDFQRYIFVVW